MVKVAPAMMCADLANLEREVRELEAAHVDQLHFDVMDGHFVRNIMGPDTMAAVRGITGLPFEVHLMVTCPDDYTELCARAGADIISFHAEASTSAYRTIKLIRKVGCQPGLVINPSTPPCAVRYILEDVVTITVMTVDPGFAGQEFIPRMLDKIEEVKALIADQGLNCLIQVDGAVNKRTLAQVIRAGADILVVGASGLFRAGQAYSTTVEEIKSLARSLRL
ncbi:MAG TPA: ribulose-phosphate 3-epimerase [Firmicutes bacterium]|nr:ribulose-phosphate 3-epimerase [Bacillota bacterium]